VKLAHRVTVLTTMAIAVLAAAGTASAAAGAAPPGNAGRNAARPVTVSATIPVGQGPNQAAVDPRTGAIYVTNFQDNTVSVISGRTNTVVATIAMGPGVSALQDGVNPRTSRLYVINEDNAMPVINTRTNAVITTADLADSEPGGIAVNPRTNKIYVTEPGLGLVAVISGRTDTVQASIPLSGTLGVAVNPRTNKIYITNDNFPGESFSVIDGRTNAVTATIPLDGEAFGVAVNPRTNAIYITSLDLNVVWAISGRTNAILATVPVGDEPLGVAVNPRTNTIYVTNAGDNTVSVLRS
jgi:YVTN family beta-propeller protein